MALCIRTSNGVVCGFPVASGGDRHKEGACPIRGRHGEHHMARQRAKRRAGYAADFHVNRGAAIAGTGKPAASSDKTKKKVKV